MVIREAHVFKFLMIFVFCSKIQLEIDIKKKDHQNIKEIQLTFIFATRLLAISLHDIDVWESNTNGQRKAHRDILGIPVSQYVPAPTRSILVLRIVVTLSHLHPPPVLYLPGSGECHANSEFDVATGRFACSRNWHRSVTVWFALRPVPRRTTIIST